MKSSPPSTHPLQTEELLCDLYGDCSANYSVECWLETGRREQERRNRLRRTARCALPAALLAAAALSLAQLWSLEVRTLVAARPSPPAAAAQTPVPAVRTLNDSELIDLASDYGRRTAMLIEIAGRKHLVVLDPSLQRGFSSD